MYKYSHPERYVIRWIWLKSHYFLVFYDSAWKCIPSVSYDESSYNNIIILNEKSKDMTNELSPVINSWWLKNIYYCRVFIFIPKHKFLFYFFPFKPLISPEWESTCPSHWSSTQKKKSMTLIDIIIFFFFF